jgi:hypothetical protein
MLDLTLSASAAGEATGLIAAAAGALNGGAERGPMFALLPTASEVLAHRLEDAGFREAGEYVSLVHRTTRPLTLPKAAPAVAKNAVGV